MSRLDREHFVVLHLDGKNRVIAKETVSIGSLNQSIVHPREVFKVAVHNGSAAIICAHNHPTGDPKPSIEDKTVTKRLAEVGAFLGIPILDHIIIGDGRYYSFSESSDIEMGKRLSL
jgi:DNA repair protein RadC